MTESYRLNTALSKFTQTTVLVYQAIAVVSFLASLILGFEWLSKPFPGGFFEQTMVLNGSDTREAGKQWALYAQGFDLGDQLLSVDNRPVSNARDLAVILDSLTIGQTVPVQLRTSAGEVRSAEIALQSLSNTDRVSYFYLPVFLSALFLMISLWIFGLRRTESAG